MKKCREGSSAESPTKKGLKNPFVDKVKIIREGIVKKGGINYKPSTERPDPPKGQSVVWDKEFEDEWIEFTHYRDTKEFKFKSGLSEYDLLKKYLIEGKIRVKVRDGAILIERA